MSRSIQLHPFSFTIGAVTVAGAALLVGGRGAAGPPSPLDYMSVVQIDDCPVDANGDGVVNVDDLMQVILAWGMVCP